MCHHLVDSIIFQVHAGTAEGGPQLLLVDAAAAIGVNRVKDLAQLAVGLVQKCSGEARGHEHELLVGEGAPHL